MGSLRKQPITAIKHSIQEEQPFNGRVRYSTCRVSQLPKRRFLSLPKIDYQQISSRSRKCAGGYSLISGYISNKPAIRFGNLIEGDLLYEVVNIDKVTLSFMASEYDLKSTSLLAKT
ncbi:hypothetical protein O9929_15145 [Vibrio lentus]|nr:hypothetical protein [Vibrio lentus]